MPSFSSRASFSAISGLTFPQVKVATDFPYSRHSALLTGDAGSEYRRILSAPAGSPCNQDINLAQLLHCPSDRLVLGKYRRLQIEACTQPRQRYRCRIPGQALYKGVECLGGLRRFRALIALSWRRTFLSNWYSSNRRGSACNCTISRSVS